MASSAVWGKGSAFYIGADDTTSLNTGDLAGQIKGSISYPGLEVEKIDITNHSSPRNFKEYIAGPTDFSSFSMDLVYTEADLQRLQARTGKNVKMRACLCKADGTFNGTLPNTTPRVDFIGMIQKLEVDASVDKEIMIKLTIQCSGNISYTWSS